MRLTSKGQVTVPQHIREQAGLAPGCSIEFHFENGRVWLTRSDEDEETRRLRIRSAIHAVAGRSSANTELSTDDIMALTRGES